MPDKRHDSAATVDEFRWALRMCVQYGFSRCRKPPVMSSVFLHLFSTCLEVVLVGGTTSTDGRD